MYLYKVYLLIFAMTFSFIKLKGQVKRKELRKVCTIEKQNRKLWKTGMTSIGRNTVLAFLTQCWRCIAPCHVQLSMTSYSI